MVLARHKTLIAVAAAVLLVALVAGSFIALRRDRRVTGAAAPSPSPPATAQLRSPFTGEPVPSLNRVLAVKIDNVVYARPQTGLARADIVYVLPVEGGLSRLMAIFSSRYPPVVGPVRSAREDDLQLLRQFGRPAFAYSGATPRLLPYIHRTAPDREPVRGHHQRVLPRPQPGRPLQPVRAHAAAAGAGTGCEHGT